MVYFLPCAFCGSEDGDSFTQIGFERRDNELLNTDPITICIKCIGFLNYMKKIREDQKWREERNEPQSNSKHNS